MSGAQDVRAILEEASEVEPAVPTAPPVTGGVHGSVLFKGAKDWQILGPGTTGQLLRTQGADKDVIWS